MSLRTITVEATVTVSVEVPEDWTKSEIQFDIENNHCPGTGSVGAVIDHFYAEGEAASVCWACDLKGKNKVVDFGGAE